METARLEDLVGNTNDRVASSKPDSPELLEFDQRSCEIWPEFEPPDPDGMCAELCREYALFIVEYWKDCRINAEMDSQHYVDVVDLCPGSGLSCWLMMQSIQRYAGIEFRYRYIPLVPHRSWLSSLLSIPEFKPSHLSGIFAPVVWDGAESAPYFIDHSGDGIWRPRNPVVILGHDRFRYLQQRLLAVHYGRLLEADFSLGEKKSQFALNESENQASQNQNNEIKWVSINKDQEERLLGISFNKYLQKFNSSPLPFPAGALQLIKKIHLLSNRGYLFISLGDGMSAEQDLRLASFSNLLNEIQTKKTLPINFHLIGQLFDNQGIYNLSRKIQEGKVLHAAIFSPSSNTQHRLGRIFTKVGDAALFHTSALIEATRSLGSMAALSIRSALLELSDFDPAVFTAGHVGLTAALAAASQSGTLEKNAWKNTLEQVWSRYLPIDHADRLHQYLAPAAMHCGAWGLAKRALIRGMACFGESAVDLANLAWCESRTGNADSAQALVSRALQLDPDCMLAIEVLRRVNERLATRNDSWRCVLRDTDSGLVLEPLDKSHADALFYQYRDPQIAIMTGLPEMKSREQALQWIEEQGNDDKKINYVIMLPEEGLAGFINLAVSEHAAFFCFWSGVDFQGRGVAGAAGKIACQHAIRSGVTIILTSAFRDNYRSIKSLRRMGFIEIPIRALPPDNDRIFFILDDHNSVDLSKSVHELISYYAREKLTINFPSSEDTAVIEAKAVTLKSMKDS